MTTDPPTDRYIDLLAAVIRRAALDAQGRPICTGDSASTISRRTEAAAFLAWARRELVPLAETDPIGEIIEVRY